MPDNLTIDQAAIDARKPSVGPLVQPDEAIAIALNMIRWVPGQMHGPEDRTVSLVMKAVHISGWKFEPR